MKTIFSGILLLLTFAAANGQAGETLIVDDEIKLVGLADNIYIYMSVAPVEGFGLVSSNGMVIIEGQEAVMIDTPMDDRQTEILTRFIEDSLGARTLLLVATHWHDDCLGGIDFLHGYGAQSLSGSLTGKICRQRGLTAPRSIFEDRIELEIGGRQIICQWPGGGHTTDNIVVWLPGERILFGGCLVKDTGSRSLGNTADADLVAWPGSIRRLQEDFPDARVIVPGHGKPGGSELFDHTLALLGM
ncbi:MAG: subclass B1 metallo-beta-lactamase [Alistipes sp.]|nr:subclass B1 metallo-beta-lactamase [Alistipes sp.]